MCGGTDSAEPSNIVSGHPGKPTRCLTATDCAHARANLARQRSLTFKVCPLLNSQCCQQDRLLCCQLSLNTKALTRAEGLSWGQPVWSKAQREERCLSTLDQLLSRQMPAVGLMQEQHRHPPPPHATHARHHIAKSCRQSEHHMLMSIAVPPRNEDSPDQDQRQQLQTASSEQSPEGEEVPVNPQLLSRRPPAVGLVSGPPEAPLPSPPGIAHARHHVARRCRLCDKLEGDVCDSAPPQRRGLDRPGQEDAAVAG